MASGSHEHRADGAACTGPAGAARVRSGCILAVGVVLVLASPAWGVNILFYGNSFTQGAGGVERIVAEVAQAAGLARPNVVTAAISGASLSQHLAFNTAIVSGSLPAGETWDAVVLQDHSLQCTHLGDPQGHRDAVLGLAAAVRAHSPSASVVLFETWARAPGHEYYVLNPPEYPGGPSQMQGEIRAGYHASLGDLGVAFPGADHRLARVGDAFELGSWDRLHDADRWHANARGSLVAGLVLFSTWYGVPTRGLDLSAAAARIGVDPGEAPALSRLADAVMVPAPGWAGLAWASCAVLGTRRRRG